MVEVTRSNVVESIHYGTAILINSDGKILKEWGNSNMMIYPRSALKPIQSLNLYKDGVAETINLSDELIALTTASIGKSLCWHTAKWPQCFPEQL